MQPRTKKKDFKYLLRQTVSKIIPRENLYNRKRGFVGLESQAINHNFNDLTYGGDKNNQAQSVIRRVRHG